MMLICKLGCLWYFASTANCPRVEHKQLVSNEIPWCLCGRQRGRLLVKLPAFPGHLCQLIKREYCGDLRRLLMILM